MAFDPGLAQHLRELLHDQSAITERRMFGGLAFLNHGHMVVGILGSTLMARVGPEQYAVALARPGVRPMDFTGRPMTGYVDAEVLSEDAALADWLAVCLAFTATLPPKI